MSELTVKDLRYVANTYSRFPVELAKGKGSEVFDFNGKRYIDMGSGIGVTAFGFCDERWVSAVTEQLCQIQHSSNLYYTKPCVELAEVLCERTKMKKVFFGNSGAEANECAIKVARKYACEKKGKDYNVIITLENSFHGRTITTLAATGQDVFHKNFQPLTEGFVYAKANDIESVKKLVKENKVAAIMFECIQGEGGVIPLDTEFVKGLQKIADEEDIVLIVDEVQTGNGRTGCFYAYMNYSISPDVVTTAKGLGGGLPIGVCIMGAKVENVLQSGDHGSTYGGNPVCSAGALNIIKRIDDKLLAEVREKSKYVFDKLSCASGIESVTGKGLMIGVKTVKNVKEVINGCIENGVLVLSAKDKVRLLPALNIPFDLLKEAVEIILRACAL